ncbi:MAG: ATP cone domain-containing protein, partial [Betaproteobacteria bacterium]|nr:ATP cone domain-containing protein [Betaproteobacteria bacterium]
MNTAVSIQPAQVASTPLLPRHIVKRDGSSEPFEAARIVSALARAGAASGEFDAEEANLLAARVLKVIRHRYGASEPTVEQVQDIVEQALIDANHFAT